MAAGYVELHRQGKLEERIEQALEMLRECKLCPHECGVDRTKDERGKCRTGRKALVTCESSCPNIPRTE